MGHSLNGILEYWIVGMLGKIIHRMHLKAGIMECWNAGWLEKIGVIIPLFLHSIIPLSNIERL